MCYVCGWGWGVECPFNIIPGFRLTQEKKLNVTIWCLFEIIGLVSLFAVIQKKLTCLQKTKYFFPFLYCFLVIVSAINDIKSFFLAWEKVFGTVNSSFLKRALISLTNPQLKPLYTVSWLDIKCMKRTAPKSWAKYTTCTWRAAPKSWLKYLTDKVGRINYYMLYM